MLKDGILYIDITRGKFLCTVGFCDCEDIMLDTSQEYLKMNFLEVKLAVLVVNVAL